MLTPLMHLISIILAFIEKENCKEKEIHLLQQGNAIHERNNCFRKLKKLYKLKKCTNYQLLKQNCWFLLWKSRKLTTSDINESICHWWQSIHFFREFTDERESKWEREEPKKRKKSQKRSKVEKRKICGNDTTTM